MQQNKNTFWWGKIDTAPSQYAGYDAVRFPSPVATELLECYQKQIKREKQDEQKAAVHAATKAALQAVKQKEKESEGRKAKGRGSGSAEVEAGRRLVSDTLRGSERGAGFGGQAA